MTEEIREQKKAMIIELTPKLNYNIGKVCKKVGVSRNTIKRWCDADEQFKEDYEECFACDVDSSEEKMYLLRQGLAKFDDNGRFVGWTEKPHFGALTKHLEAKGRDRGWGQNVTINPDDNEKFRQMTDEELFAFTNRMNAGLQDETWDISKDGQVDEQE